MKLWRTTSRKCDAATSGYTVEWIRVVLSACRNGEQNRWPLSQAAGRAADSDRQPRPCDIAGPGVCRDPVRDPRRSPRSRHALALLASAGRRPARVEDDDDPGVRAVAG